MDLKTNFGKQLQQLRTHANLTQSQLAEACDVSIDTISNIERGIHGPRFELLERLAISLDVTIDTLFTFPNRQKEQ